MTLPPERLRQIADVVRSLSGTLDRQGVLAQVIAAVMTLRRDQRCTIRLVDRAAGGYRLAAAAGESARDVPVLLPFGSGLTDVVAQTRRSLLVADIRDDPRAEAARAGGRPVTYYGAPIEAAGELLGVLNVEFPLDDPPAADECELIDLFAAQAAVAIRNATLFAESEARRREEEVVGALARSLAASLDLATVLERIAEGALELCASDMATLALRDPVDDTLVVRHRVGVGHAPTMPLRIERGRGMGGRIMLTGRPYRTAHYRADANISHDYVPSVVEEGMVAVLGVPIMSGGRVEGVIFVVNRDKREFSDRDEAVLMRLADHAAVGIHNAALYEAAELRASRLRALARVNRLVSSSLAMGEVLTGIARAAAELMNGVFASFWLADEPTRTLTFGAVSDERLWTDYPVSHMSFDEGVVGAVARTRKRLEVPDVFADGRIVAPDWFRRNGLRSYLGLPIVFQDSVVAVLNLNAAAPFRLGRDEEELFDAFTAQAAVAIHNARLYEELRVAHQRLEASQAELVQTERLRALGEMAGGVAHDFNNLLAIILGRADLLLTRVKDPDIARGLDAMRRAAWDGAQIVRRIQEFTRTRQVRPLGRVDLVEIVHEVVELTGPRWKDDARSRGVHYDVRVEGDAAAPAAGEPAELREVFTNLILNALEAMPAGGECVCRVVSDGTTITASVRDNGVGMDEQTRRRVFEPFFTTKGPRGTGLGLAVVWGIVSRHMGTIDVESAPGTGTRFVVRLPVARLEAAAAPSLPPPVEPVTGGRVLIIEDEPDVRSILAEMLAGHGYTVVTAASGAEGLACCEADPVDLVVSDLSMPGMSGWEVAAACHERFPALPVGFITGWGDRLDPEQLARQSVRFVLAKPFRRGDVLRHVAEALKLV